MRFHGKIHMYDMVKIYKVSDRVNIREFHHFKNCSHNCTRKLLKQNIMQRLSETNVTGKTTSHFLHFSPKKYINIFGTKVLLFIRK